MTTWMRGPVGAITLAAVLGSPFLGPAVAQSPAPAERATPAAPAAPAEPAAATPEPAEEEPPLLRPTFELGLMGAASSNAWFGQPEAVVGAPVSSWTEGMLEVGLDLHAKAGTHGVVVGRVSGHLSWTRGGVDAAGSNVEDRTPEDLVLHHAWLGWRSQSKAPGFEVSAGRLDYKIGTGFVFGDGGYEGDDRGAFWMNGHDAWRLGVVSRMVRGPAALRVAYVEPDDLTTTRILGADVEVDLGGRGLVGGSLHRLLDSDAEQEIGVPGRDGLDVIGVRAVLTPVSSAPGVSVNTELAFQRNGDSRHATAWYVQPGYAFEDVRWSPSLSYRYSSFSGDDPETPEQEDWDPLFYAFDDWGTWYLGEILGEFVFVNSNLRTSQVQFEVAPAESLRAIASYYHFDFDTAPAGLDGRAPTGIGDEFDAVVEWTITPHLQVSVIGGLLSPGEALRDLTGGSGNWTHGMVYARVTF